MTKPILCLDFDGVIHDYREGWNNGTIYGNVTPGFFDWAIEAAKYFRLVIYGSRSKSYDGVMQMRQWLRHQIELNKLGLDILALFEFAHNKPPAYLTIDDRALTFTGDWRDFNVEKLKAFKTWSQ